MTALERAIHDIANALESLGIPYAVTPEDVILMKIISHRPRDLADAEAITRRRLPDLDRGSLDPRIRELALSLEQPDIADRWRKWTSA